MRGSRYITTACIHAGEKPDLCTGAIIPPIYQTTTFDFANSEAIEDAMEGKEAHYFYSRYGNPTLTVLENKMASLEGTASGLALASGNAATIVAILLYAKSGDYIICMRDVYGGTYAILTDLAKQAGIEATFVDTTDISEIEKAFTARTRLVFLETPTNPDLKVSDIKAIADLAHSRGAKLVVDNTFATPVNQNPLRLDADLVTHSMTKFLNGHSDVTGGILVGSDEDIARCRELMKQTGASLNPIDAWLVIRGIKTLAIRIERHNSNAMQVSEFLRNHSGVEKVYYPGLRDHPQHEVAVKQMCGFGGIISFVVKGGYGGARKVIDKVHLAMRAVSLGSIETLITQPAATSHRCIPKDIREKWGIEDGLLRLSVGIEDVRDIITDLDQAISV